jgi:hypothetical protein
LKDENLMARSRFVSPEVVRLTLSDHDWIDIKKRLNTGEQRAVFAKMARDITPGEKIALDPLFVGAAKIAAYLLAWSFVDDDGRPVALEPSAIDNLDPDTYREIREAIEAHEEKVDKEIEARKNDQSSTSGGSPSSERTPLSVGP